MSIIWLDSDRNTLKLSCKQNLTDWFSVRSRLCVLQCILNINFKICFEPYRTVDVVCYKSKLLYHRVYINKLLFIYYYEIVSLKFFVENRRFKPPRERFMSVESICLNKYFSPLGVSVGQIFDIAHTLAFSVGFFICHGK